MQTIIRENWKTGQREVVGTRPARSHKQCHAIREELIALNAKNEHQINYYAE